MKLNIHGWTFSEKRTACSGAWKGQKCSGKSLAFLFSLIAGVVTSSTWTTLEQNQFRPLWFLLGKCYRSLIATSLGLSKWFPGEMHWLFGNLIDLTVVERGRHWHLLGTPSLPKVQTVWWAGCLGSYLIKKFLWTIEKKTWLFCDVIHEVGQLKNKNRISSLVK